MNEKKTIILISITTALCGMLFLSFQAGWLIIRYPSYHHEIQQQKALMYTKRTEAALYFFKNNTICQEKVDILWTQSNAHNIQYLVNSWLTFLDEEQLMHKKVTVTHVLLSSNEQDAYISFDRNPLDKQASTYTKWMWIETLLKTIAANNITIARVHFLVHHKPLNDTHLELSHPWPLHGYTKID